MTIASTAFFSLVFCDFRSSLFFDRCHDRFPEIFENQFSSEIEKSKASIFSVVVLPYVSVTEYNRQIPILIYFLH